MTVFQAFGSAVALTMTKDMRWRTHKVNSTMAMFLVFRLHYTPRAEGGIRYTRTHCIGMELLALIFLIISISVGEKAYACGFLDLERRNAMVSSPRLNFVLFRLPPARL